MSRLRKVLDPSRTGKDAESLERTLMKLIIGCEECEGSGKSYTGRLCHRCSGGGTVWLVVRAPDSEPSS